MNANISGLQGNNPKGGGKRSDGKHKHGGGNKSDINDVTACSYTQEEWQKLSLEQRDKIRALCAAKKIKTSEQPTGRNASSLTLQDGGGTSQGIEAEVETPGTAGSRRVQFANGNSNGRG